MALTLIVLACWMSRKPNIDAEELYCRITILIAVMFMLSPTQYPWYYLWLAPFLVLYPVFALFALTALLPIYYLRFYFHARGQMIWFEQVIIWFEYLPVLALLLAEWILSRQTARSGRLFSTSRKTTAAQTGLAEPDHV